MPESDPTPAPPQRPAAYPLLRDLLHGYVPVQLLYVAARLGLADAMSVGPQPVAALAAATGVAPAVLLRVLRGLVTYGMVVEEEDGRFSLTGEGYGLVSTAPGSLAGMALYTGEVVYQAWGDLLGAVQTGDPATRRLFGTSLYEHLAERPALSAYFSGMLHSLAALTAQALLAAYDFSGVQSLVDVGGGYGTILAAVLRAYPAMRGLLFDQAGVVERGAAALTEAGVADRAVAQAGDFFTAVPMGGDCYLLAQILHNWDDAACVEILRRCRAALGPGARLLILEPVMPERVIGPSRVVELDLVMLVMLGGRERTLAEHRALLAAAGMALTRYIPTASPHTIVEAMPVAEEG